MMRGETKKGGGSTSETWMGRRKIKQI